MNAKNIKVMPKGRPMAQPKSGFKTPFNNAAVTRPSSGRSSKRGGRY